MRDIIHSGVKTKVLMLSATPVNNRMNDLKNQVAFITEGRDDALYEPGHRQHRADAARRPRPASTSGCAATPTSAPPTACSKP